MGTEVRGGTESYLRETKLTDQANNQGAPMRVARGPQRAPELPATAWWILMEKLQKFQREEDEDED